MTLPPMAIYRRRGGPCKKSDRPLKLCCASDTDLGGIIDKCLMQVGDWPRVMAKDPWLDLVLQV
jgi:hypothetical protein